MFGRKKEKTVEQQVKKYSSFKRFQKDQRKLEKLGWYVRAQSTKLEKKGFFSRVNQEVILVTFEREV